MARVRAAATGVLAFAVALVLAGSVALAQAGGSSAAQKSVPKTGAPAPQAAQPPGKTGAHPPEAKVAGSFGNWTLLCGKEHEGDKERCSLVMPLVEKDSQKLVFRVILTYGPQGRLVLRVDGPTGIALQRGIEFSPYTKKIYRMPFQTCLPMGCKALLLVEDDMRKEIAASKQGSITVYALNGSPVKTLAALDGFADGMAALDKHVAN